MWEEHSAPSIYLWPYDIPYSRSEELRKIILDRVGDVPAFFGMGPDEEKDHQERILSRVLFGSIVVHILFLDNSKTDTSQGFEERNETYAQFCTFKEIVQWSRDLKQVMDGRFLNSESKSQHILVLIARDEQVVASREEIQELNKLIGRSASGEYKPFSACYFLDMNLKPEPGRLFHSKYVWDVLVSRFLLALLLSQEQKKTGDNGPSGDRLTPLLDNPGVKIWRASDCMISVQQDSSQAILKRMMERAIQKLHELLSKDSDGKRLRLLNDVVVDRNSLNYELESSWDLAENEDPPNFDLWAAKKDAAWSFSHLRESFFHDWSGLPVSGYVSRIESPEHWQKGLAKLEQERVSWSKNHPPEDYTPAVKNFFEVIRRKPGELNRFILELSEKVDSTHKGLSEGKTGHPKTWADLVKVENERREVLKRLAEDSKEFKKAQDHYVGTGIGLIIMASVTLFSGWIIWQVLSLFKVGAPMIFLLFAMVFAGSAAACLLVMLLHNFTGNRAAGWIMAECKKADEKMMDRDDIVREMFFDGIKKRDTLALQCVRFRTLRLAQRTLSILLAEMDPQQSTRLMGDENADLMPEAVGPSDPDHVREAYLNLTRENIGTLRIRGNDMETKLLEKYIEGNEPGSFLCLWKELCMEDHCGAGYFPARKFISRIRTFVADFLEAIHHSIFDASIKNSGDTFKQRFMEFTRKLHFMDDISLTSASLSDYSGHQTAILFVNSSFFEFRFNNPSPDLQESPSRLLETTRTAALFYQEFDVDFDIEPIPGSQETDSGYLTFKSK